MTFMKRIAGTAALGAAMLFGLFAPPAQASYIVNLTQVGSNVVATGSGTIDLTDLISNTHLNLLSYIAPGSGTIVTGPASGTYIVDDYTGFIGPASFGAVGTLDASSGSGDMVGIDSTGDLLAVPSGYVSGSALSDTSTYLGQTFATLGATPGTYVWTWGSGANADSFTLNIGGTAAVPEPSSLALLMLPLGLLMLLAARPRRAMRGA